jgi:hypothetical protein
MNRQYFLKFSERRFKSCDASTLPQFELSGKSSAQTGGKWFQRMTMEQ